MAIRQLHYCEDEILRKKCWEVETINQRILELLDDMMDTLHSAKNGAALAANQIGILKRLIVIDYCGKVLKLINPKIVKSSGKKIYYEGCLSFPNQFIHTIRPQKITVQTLTPKREQILFTVHGEMAKCLCHEIDHLDGILFLDRAADQSDIKQMKYLHK